jgi:hypothetical protein
MDNELLQVQELEAASTVTLLLEPPMAIRTATFVRAKKRAAPRAGGGFGVFAVAVLRLGKPEHIEKRRIDR